MRELLRAHRPAAVVNFAAETHVDRSIDGPARLRHDQPRGHLRAARGAAPSCRGAQGAVPAASSTSRRTRSTARSDPTGLFSEDTPYAPNSPYAASKAGADHLVRAYHETYGLRRPGHELLEQLRPLPVPGEAHPAHDPERDRGQGPCPSTATAATCATGSTSRTTARASAWPWSAGAPGEKYNIGGGNERTNLEVVERICAILDRERPPASNPALREAGDRVATRRSRPS